MIRFRCTCGAIHQLHESKTANRSRCKLCGHVTHWIVAEQLPDDAGAGDFDAYFAVEEGTAAVGEALRLGGVVDILIGRAAENQICMGGHGVSRAHAKLVRVDFGPSRWKIQDTNSRAGVFINGEKVAEQELQDGDLVQIGCYKLRYRVSELPSAPTAAATKKPLAQPKPRYRPSAVFG